MPFLFVARTPHSAPTRRMSIQQYIWTMNNDFSLTRFSCCGTAALHDANSEHGIHCDVRRMPYNYSEQNGTFYDSEKRLLWLLLFAVPFQHKALCTGKLPHFTFVLFFAPNIKRLNKSFMRWHCLARRQLEGNARPCKSGGYVGSVWT